MKYSFTVSKLIRYSPLAASLILTLLGALFLKFSVLGLVLFLVFGFLLGVGIYDLIQRRHSILRNYPVIGHMRFILEFIRPEIRQYFIEGDLEAQPFSRAQRSLVYQRAKGVPDVRPFGTQFNVKATGYEWVSHSVHTTQIDSHDFRTWIGGTPDNPNQGAKPCTQPYDASVFNISAMSFGSLSGNAVLAMNKGARDGDFAQDTGEGSISRYHREYGGDLIWEIGSGYFGCRHSDGSFSPERFAEQATDPQVKMVEIKISQGAKPGHGGILPASKLTAEVAEARGIPMGQDCISPSSHSAFSTPVEMAEFIGQLRELSDGKPIGIKLSIGHVWEWFGMVKGMLETNITPDFIVVDGAEGGTGAAPVELTDHVGSPVQEALRLVHNTLVGVRLRSRVKIGAAGKINSAFGMARMFALGADWCNAGRAFMMSVGCIQAQICHTGLCPTGVTTQDPIRQRALVVEDKAPRVTQFHANTLNALKELLQSAGLTHPDELTPYHIVRRISDSRIRLLSAVMPNMKSGALLENLEHQSTIFRLYWPLADAHNFAPRMPMAGEMPRDPDEPPQPFRGGGKPATPDQIVRELMPPRQSHPEPQSEVVPEQGSQPNIGPDSEEEAADKTDEDETDEDEDQEQQKTG